MTSIRSLPIFSQYMLPRLACKAAGVINSAARSFAVRPFPAAFARRGFADTFTPIRAVVDCADPLGASPPVPLHDADMPPIDRRIGFMGSGQVNKRAALLRLRCCLPAVLAAVVCVVTSACAAYAGVAGCSPQPKTVPLKNGNNTPPKNKRWPRRSPRASSTAASSRPTRSAAPTRCRRARTCSGRLARTPTTRRSR